MSLLGLDFKLRDLTLQLEALSRVLDELDAQIGTNIQEIITVRIPEAMYYVERDLLKSNNLWYTGALVSGQFFKKKFQKNLNFLKIFDICRRRTNFTRNTFKLGFTKPDLRQITEYRLPVISRCLVLIY